MKYAVWKIMGFMWFYAGVFDTLADADAYAKSLLREGYSVVVEEQAA